MIHAADSSASATSLIPVYRAMLTARLIDRCQAAFVRRGEAFFHIPGEGHEAIAALGPHLSETDWLACHYRDKALLVYRGVPPRFYLATQLCRSNAPGAGRQLPDILCDHSRNVMSMPVPVGNHALQAVGVAAALSESNSTHLTVCCVGDGTTQQGEYLEAIAEAVRRSLPVLFVVEDNGYAISTPTTASTFLSLPSGPASEFYGLPIQRIDGRDPAAAYGSFGQVVQRVRVNRKPALVCLRTVRLTSHTNADDQAIYRSTNELQTSQESDPLISLERWLLTCGLTAFELAAIRIELEAVIDSEAEATLAAADPEPIRTAKAPLPSEQSDHSREYRGMEGGERLTMREAIGAVLRHRLETDPRVILTGQDIEDPKGDVFGVTQGLSTSFPGRVVNAALTESTIIGTAIGRALVGQRPVAFLQFADFLPLAFNQIASELGSMYWRTNGGYSCPVVVMVACGGYKPGMGPFHAQTFESIVAHVPGVDVVMPYSAADAAGLLNAAMESPRPTIFYYPKAALNLAAESTSIDVSRQFVPLGVSRHIRTGQDLTIVAWGNTVDLCRRVAEALGLIGIESSLIDLRSISPWDEASVLESVHRTGRLLVVHEDSQTCGFGSEILACVAERSTRHIRSNRVTRPDTYVSCHFANQLELLPSFRSTLTAAAELLGLDLEWEPPTSSANGRVVVPAIGSGPSDESVLILKLLVSPHAVVQVGDPIAVVEASKSTVEMVAPVSGVVESVGAVEGERVPVGFPLFVLRNDDATRRLPVTQEPLAIPHLSRQPIPIQITQETRLPSVSRTVGIGIIVGLPGGWAVGNDELLVHHPGRTVEDVYRRTGIETRYWVGPGENALTLAVAATRQTLAQAGISVGDLDLIVCSTGSPLSVTPSLACRILAEVGDAGEAVAAYDVNAACSGYLYALQIAHDFLQAEPAGRVLVVTAETPSTKLDVRDFDTAFLFGDAATATLVVGEEHTKRATCVLHRPVLSARGENGSALSVPFDGMDNYIVMQGAKVYSEAVRSMGAILQRACHAARVQVEDLAIVVPHQANKRILDAVGQRLKVPVLSNIHRLGNTSSSSIPMALREILSGSLKGHIGLCAFGGGFTSAGAVLTCTGGASVKV